MLFNAELMPRRRRGGMGWETWQSDSEAEARGKKRPSCARIGRLKPAPPRQVTGEKQVWPFPGGRAARVGHACQAGETRPHPSYARMDKAEAYPTGRWRGCRDQRGEAASMASSSDLADSADLHSQEWGACGKKGSSSS